MTGPTLLVGCGKMGSALLDGWLERGLAEHQIHVVETHKPTAEALRSQPRGAAPSVRVHSSADAMGGQAPPDAVVFAVKPQSLGGMIGDYRGFAGPDAVFLSIAAGKRLEFFEQNLGSQAAIVRAMPNTPAAIGRGISVAVANQNVSAAQRARCQSLLEAVGEVAWVDDEALLDPVTAVSGSGPAYVFLLIECLAEAGVAVGLEAGLSARLALATVSGAGELARLSGDAPDVLRQNVTSPGGTTEAAIGVLMAGEGMRPLLVRAVEAATARSRELAG